MGGKRGANRGFWDKGTVSKERMESHSEPLLNMAEREADVRDSKPREARVRVGRQESEARRQPQAAATCSQPLSPADADGRVSLVDMVRSLKAAGTTSRLLPCGGIEAVPRLPGDDVATRLSQSGLDSLPWLLNGRADRSAITGIKSGVGSGACSVSHGQLLEFVKRGGGLAECGVSVGDRVGVLLPNGPEMAVCLLACMATCVAMPINHQMVRSSSLLLANHLVKANRSHQVKAICLSSLFWLSFSAFHHARKPQLACMCACAHTFLMQDCDTDCK